MKSSTAGKVMGVIILFISLVVLPIFYISIVDWREDSNRIQIASRDFIDRAIDAGQVTSDMEADLNLDLAACTGNFVYTITVETKITNPKFDDSGNVVGYTTVWVPIAYKKGDTLQRGDIITLTVEQSDFGLFQKFAIGLLGVSFNKMDCVTPGMVR